LIFPIDFVPIVFLPIHSTIGDFMLIDFIRGYFLRLFSTAFRVAFNFVYVRIFFRYYRVPPYRAQISRRFFKR